MKRWITILIAIQVMATVVSVMAQNTQSKLVFTAEKGCPVICGVVDLSQAVADGTILEGKEAKKAMKKYRKSYTGWQISPIRVRKAKVFAEEGNDVYDYIYERIDMDGNVFDIQIFSEEWGWLELDPDQEKMLGEVYSMASVITHMDEMDSQRLS